MIVEHPRTLFWKKLAAHGFLIAFIALILFPFLIVLSISLRPGNFSTGTLIPAGQTDILGSFTFRMSFQDAGQSFGIAGAISTMIFVIVGLMAYANFFALRKAAEARGRG